MMFMTAKVMGSPLSTLLLLIPFFAILIRYFVAKWFFEAAIDKGYQDKKYFWICFLFGFTGQLLVVALPNKRLKAAIENNHETGMKNG